MSELKAEATSQDEIRITKTPDTNGPVWAKVKVTAPNGLVKNGQTYEDGDTAYFSLAAAQRFQAEGDCEILEDNVAVRVESDTDELGRTINEKVVVDEN